MKHQELLSSELAVVRGEMTRVDAKSSLLAALTGGAAAFTASRVGGHAPAGVRVLFAVAGVALVAAALLLLLAVIRPRLGAGGFCQYASMDWRQLDQLFTSGYVDIGPARVFADEVELADLKALSGLVKRKYRRMRTAVDLAAAGVVALGAAVIGGVIA